MQTAALERDGAADVERTEFQGTIAQDPRPRERHHAILYKAGPLTDEEWTVMRMHTIEGERICSGLKAFRLVLPIIRHHHEKMDGTGYPDGLKGEEIPMSARVLQTVDIFDALTTARPYKPAMSVARALEIMQQEVHKGWRDPRVFEEFRNMLLEEEAAEAELSQARAG